MNYSLVLHGCTEEPLGSYLKALGILRLVAEQVDAEARGCWESGRFVLASSLDRDMLIDYFLNNYDPTPIVGPWNAGSGFYSKDRKVGLDGILRTTGARFAAYRNGLEICRAIVGEAGEENAGNKDWRRGEILRLCRNRLSDAAVDWLDAAIAIDVHGERGFAPILGTGGNEGRLDYTNNFMENVFHLLISPDKKTGARTLLENALFDTPTNGLQDLAVGQYDPGRAGGYNQGEGLEAKSIANPWNAILTMEGGAGWAGGLYRKQGVAYRSYFCSPFTVRPTAAGFGSAAEKDDVTARAEVWTPLWDRPARYSEIRSLLREARANTGKKAAQNGFEFAQAVTSLGVDRGIQGFMRYLMLKRRGDSYVASSAGLYSVGRQVNSLLLEGYLDWVRQAAKIARNGQKDGPGSWEPLQRNATEAAMDAIQDDKPERFVDVVAATGAIRQWLLERGRSDVDQLRLRKESWFDRCTENDNRLPEVRIAASIAGMAEIEQHFLSGGKNYSWTGSNLANRMAGTLRRRVLFESKQEEAYFHSKIYPQIGDIAKFLDGSTDDDLIEKLIYGFLSVRLGRRNSYYEDTKTWPSYATLKQVFRSGSLDAEKGRIRPDLTVLGLIEAKRIKDAVGVAQRKLINKGYALAEVEIEDGVEPSRMSAALLIPISNPQCRNLMYELMGQEKKQGNE